jgi:hypothetical protein
MAMLTLTQSEDVSHVAFLTTIDDDAQVHPRLQAGQDSCSMAGYFGW